MSTLAAATPTGFTDDVTVLAAALDDPETAVREGAARALAAVADADAPAVRDADAVPSLVDALDDADADVRPLVGLLLERLAHDAPEERRRSARALTRSPASPRNASSAAARTDDPRPVLVDKRFSGFQ